MAPSKFEWKPLTLTPINFSLTEGTQIPAPLDSPPDSPRPPTPGKGPLSSHPTPKADSFPQNGASESKESGEHQSTANNAPMSPTSPNRRPGSVRKFLGLRPLSSTDSLKSERPGSPNTITSQAPSLSRRKSGSWFGRKKSFNVGSVPEGRETSTSNGNGSTVSQPAQQPAKPKGPPPPALPELKTFGVSDDSLSLGADDMFKNIK